MTAFRANLPYASYHFSGDDVLSFLQGQLTQDLNLITTNHCHYGAYCDAKGRMLANFLIQKDDTGYLLQLHQALAERVIKRLQLFVLRAKVTIVALPYQAIGLNRAAAMQFCEQQKQTLPKVFTSLHAQHFLLSALPNDYFVLTLSDSTLVQSLLADLTENQDEIEALRLCGGHFHILPETNEKLFPQQTSLASWGGINYQKGCYVGQEVIARSKYRGNVKKGMGVATIAAPLELDLPATVMQDNKAVGQIIDYHCSPQQTTCLAVVNLDSLEQPATVSDQSAIFSIIH